MIKTPSDLYKINFDKRSPFVDAKDVNLFNSAKSGMKVNDSVKPDAKMILQFKSECHGFILAAVKKILERCPLKYVMTRGLSCLSPTVVLSNSFSRLDKCLNKFMELRHITGPEADQVREDFEKIQDDAQAKALLDSFDRKKDRLDALYNELYNRFKLSKPFQKFVNLILVLFHGNAAVERGFSINKYCLAENLHEESLIARRLVCDAVTTAGGPERMDITNDMLLSCKNANGRWKETLKRKREEKISQANAWVKKQKIMKDIAALEANKRELEKKAESEKNILDMKIAELKDMQK